MRDLPAGWTWKRVDEVGDVQIGRQLSPSQLYGRHMRPYLRVANVHDGRINYSDVLEMNFTPSEFVTFSLRTGDVLLNEGQSLELVGRSAIYDGPPGMCFQNTLIRFRPREVLPAIAQAIFKRWLDLGEFMKVARQTTSIAHLGSERFGAMRFPVPPRDEQRRISEILSAVDDEIFSLSTLIGKQEKLRLAAIERTLLDAANIAAPRRRLGDLIVKNMLGTTVRGGDSESTATLVKMGSLVGGGRVELVQTEPIDLPEYVRSGDLALQSGDILLNTRNTPQLVGKVGLWRDGMPSQYVPDNNLMIMRFCSDADPAFMASEMTYGELHRRIKSVALGTTSVAAVYWRDVVSLEVCLPGIEFQQSFVRMLTSVDDLIFQSSSRRSKMLSLRAALMEDLLTGRVRV